jgi:hypothetical protein
MIVPGFLVNQSHATDARRIKSRYIYSPCITLIKRTPFALSISQRVPLASEASKEILARHIQQSQVTWNHSSSHANAFT